MINVLMKLTESQIAALRALEKISQGNLSTFLNWASADSLVEIGLARRIGSGVYSLTEKGITALQQLDDGDLDE